MKPYKTVLAPNAPWPTYHEEKPLKQASKALKRVRAKPSNTDARFKQWMEKNT